MKKTHLFVSVISSLFLLLGASVWEGTAAMDEDNFSENGRFLATNSFPVNTVVDVTNLENGKQERFIVSSGLEIAGLLAVFSKDAALAIDLPSRTLIRISMSESADQTPSFGLGMGRTFSTAPEDDYNFDSDRVDDRELFVDMPLPQENGIRSVPEPVIPEYDELRLLAAEERPPESDLELEPDYFASARTPPPATAAGEYSYGIFSAPLIQNFEKGKYYLQIGAYRSVDAVEAEILKIDRQFPKAVMSIGTEREPTYRVLIGPLSLGESNALLQHYSAFYKDAFVWMGR